MQIKRVNYSVRELKLEKELLHDGFPVLSYRMVLPPVEDLSPGGFRRIDRCYRKLKKVFTAWCEGPLYQEAITAWEEALAASAPFMPYTVELTGEKSQPGDDQLLIHCNCSLKMYRKSPVTFSFPVVWHLPDGWLFPGAFSREKKGHEKKKNKEKETKRKP